MLFLGLLLFLLRAAGGVERSFDLISSGWISAKFVDPLTNEVCPAGGGYGRRWHWPTNVTQDLSDCSAELKYSTTGFGLRLENLVEYAPYRSCLAVLGGFRQELITTLNGTALLLYPSDYQLEGVRVRVGFGSTHETFLPMVELWSSRSHGLLRWGNGDPRRHEEAGFNAVPTVIAGNKTGHWRANSTDDSFTGELVRLFNVFQERFSVALMVNLKGLSYSQPPPVPVKIPCVSVEVTIRRYHAMNETVSVAPLSPAASSSSTFTSVSSLSSLTTSFSSFTSFPFASSSAASLPLFDAVQAPDEPFSPVMLGIMAVIVVSAVGAGAYVCVVRSRRLRRDGSQTPQDAGTHLSRVASSSNLRGRRPASRRQSLSVAKGGPPGRGHSHSRSRQQSFSASAHSGAGESRRRRPSQAPVVDSGGNYDIVPSGVQGPGSGTQVVPADMVLSSSHTMGAVPAPAGPRASESANYGKIALSSADSVYDHFSPPINATYEEFQRVQPAQHYVVGTDYSKLDAP